MKAAFVPWDKSINNNNIFAPLPDGKENAHTLLKKAFLENGDDINTLDMYKDLNEVDVFLFSVINYEALALIYKAGLEGRCVYCSGEPVVVKPDNCKEGYKRLGNMFPYFMTVDRNAVDDERVFFRTLPYFDYPEWGSVPFDEKKLITNISGNKHSDHPYEIYSVREEAMTYFEKNYPSEIDCYGPGWDVNEHPSYRGMCDSKAETYHYHKFALSLENTIKVPGYITEKIFDCFKYGIVPIYWGAPDVYEFIPRECFIDYTDFDSLKELSDFLFGMTKERYEEYLNAIKSFMDDPANMEPFSSREFYKNIKLVYSKMDSKAFKVSDDIKKQVYKRAYENKLREKKTETIIKLKKMIKGLTRK